MPITRDSTRATTPRSSGFFKIGYRSEILLTGFTSTSMVPSALRVPVGDTVDRFYIHVDGTVRFANRYRHVFGTAHHHAFDDRLPANTQFSHN